MKTRFIVLLLLMPLMMFAQKGITIKIEDLTKPEKLLMLNSQEDIYKGLILSDAGLSKFKVDRTNPDYKYNIVAQSKSKDSLVNFGYHPFFNGMYQAYADHRPFVLSPDMMLLLISQGFAQHVNANVDELRKYFVNFEGKLKLVVRNDDIILEDPNSPWEEVFPVFSKKISEHTGPELMNALTCDFTTTTPVTKVASEITIMEAMKPYFEYIVLRIVCGIPEIRLEGTPEDWQKVLDKARYLRKYKLDWWIDEIEPLLVNFVKASKGEADKDFWKNIFKYHTDKVYGSPKKIDGWIVKFFPYDKTGKRNNLTELNYDDKLASEMVKVDIKHITAGGVKEIVTPLEMWAGFIGLKQDPKTFSLRPEIGWMIRKKDEAKIAKEHQDMIDNFNVQARNSSIYEGIAIRVKTVPEELKGLDQIKSLWIIFSDEITIPDWLATIKIEKFTMDGKISDEGIDRICKMFPYTLLYINGKKYHYPATPVDEQKWNSVIESTKKSLGK